jgi:hypothetical protein
MWAMIEKLRIRFMANGGKRRGAGKYGEGEAIPRGASTRLSRYAVRNASIA